MSSKTKAELQKNYFFNEVKDTINRYFNTSMGNQINFVKYHNIKSKKEKSNKNNWNHKSYLTKDLNRMSINFYEKDECKLKEVLESRRKSILNVDNINESNVIGLASVKEGNIIYEQNSIKTLSINIKDTQENIETFLNNSLLDREIIDCINNYYRMIYNLPFKKAKFYAHNDLKNKDIYYEDKILLLEFEKTNGRLYLKTINIKEDDSNINILGEINGVNLGYFPLPNYYTSIASTISRTSQSSRLAATGGISTLIIFDDMLYKNDQLDKYAYSLTIKLDSSSKLADINSYTLIDYQNSFDKSLLKKELLSDIPNFIDILKNNELDMYLPVIEMLSI